MTTTTASRLDAIAELADSGAFTQTERDVIHALAGRQPALSGPEAYDLWALLQRYVGAKHALREALGMDG
jgi:hypothetical protein